MLPAALKRVLLARPALREAYFALRSLAALARHPLAFAAYRARGLRAARAGRRVVVFRALHPIDALTWGDVPARLAATGRFEVALFLDHAAQPDLARSLGRRGRVYVGGGDFLSLARADLLVLSTSSCRRFFPRGARVVFAFPTLAGLTGLWSSAEVFAGYDAFLCAGRHQVDELELLLRAGGLDGRPLLAAGYPKLDRLAAACARDAPRADPEPWVVYAPTHCHKNGYSSLAHALAIVRALRRAHLRVVFRPHPKSFDDAAERARIERVGRALGADQGFALDRALDPAGVYRRTAAIVADGTGIGFSYALATGRPAVFLDMGVRGRGLQFEARERVGVVCAEPERVGDAVRAALARGDELGASICRFRDEAVYCFGYSEARWVELLVELSSRPVPARVTTPLGSAPPGLGHGPARRPRAARQGSSQRT